MIARRKVDIVALCIDPEALDNVQVAGRSLLKELLRSLMAPCWTKSLASFENVCDSEAFIFSCRLVTL